jgi:tRNA-binding protein
MMLRHQPGLHARVPAQGFENARQSRTGRARRRDDRVRAVPRGRYPRRQIVQALPFPEARKPAYKLLIDFGPAIGRKRSSAQITEHYRLEDLPGTQVAAVVNFPPRQIGPVMSEVLTLGFPDAQGHVVLVRPSLPVPNGGRLF